MSEIYLIAVLQIHLEISRLSFLKVMNLEQLNNHPEEKKKEVRGIQIKCTLWGEKKLRTISLIVIAKLQTQH